MIFTSLQMTNNLSQTSGRLRVSFVHVIVDSLDILSAMRGCEQAEHYASLLEQGGASVRSLKQEAWGTRSH